MVRTAILSNDGFEIKIGAELSRETRIERRCRLPAGLTNFIGFKRPLDDIRD